MSHFVQYRGFGFSRSLMVLVLGALIASQVSCGNSSKPAEAPQKTFASPDEAGKALVDGAKSGDQATMLAIFGPGSKDVIYTGDAAKDKESFDGFVSAYQVMNRWRKLDESTQLLLVGAQNNAFPIPLKKNAAMQWYFDTAAGRDEILSRRIGKNELAAIDVCVALADAQAEYFSQRHDGTKQYAQKFISDAGKQNGLYWSSPEGQPRSPLGPLVVFATEQGYTIKPDSHQPFHGYYFRMLYKQGAKAKGGAKDFVNNGKMTGGFAFVAYPADYGNSGIVTFIVDQNRMIYQRDLGKSTADAAKAMADFNPDDTWKPISQ